MVARYRVSSPGKFSTCFANCAGNNQVDLADISFLGGHYGTAVGSGFECLDVGPTTDYYVTSRPRPDGVLNFEDLAVTALNYGTVVAGPLAAHRAVPTAAASGREAGIYHAAWDGRDDEGRAVAAGTFFARLTTRDQRITRTVVRIR